MNRFLKNIALAAAGLIMCALATTGCTKESHFDCNRLLYVTLRVDGPNNNPNDEAAIEDAVMYIFDEQGCLLERRPTQINKAELLQYPNAGKLTVIGWCNTECKTNGQCNVCTMTPSTSMISDGEVSMVSKGISRSGPNNIYHSPSDLFLGQATVQNNNQSEQATVYATRRVGSMTVTVRGLKLYYWQSAVPDSDYQIVVGTTKNQVNFSGQFFGTNAGLTPSAAFKNSLQSADFVTPIYNIFPSESAPLAVRVLQGNTVIADVSVDSNNVPLQTLANQTLNVLIVFTAPGNVTVTVNDAKWGVLPAWINFD